MFGADRAQFLLETTAQSVDRNGGTVGFGSPTAFRDRFKRIVGTSPHHYRSSFARKTSSTNHSSS